MFHIGVTYGISESRVYEIIKDTESIQIQDRRFHLPGKKALLKPENNFDVVLIDVTESLVERPQKTDAELFGQEKASYPKDAVGYREVEPKDNLYSLCVWSRHEFKLFRDSGVHLGAATKCPADTGYQGLAKIHHKSELPKKRTKKNLLSKQDKRENRRISSCRIAIENIIREVKIFRIIVEKYRNRRRCFALRFNLIAAIYNLAIAMD
jgi:hypothetical protein